MRPILGLAVLTLATTTAHAYKSSLAGAHFGTSLGGAYAGQLGTAKNGWDVVSKLAGSGDSYSSASASKTPLRLGFFYREPNFTIDFYAKYFTSYQSAWTISGTNSGSGNSRYKGMGGGLDFQMPMLNGPWLRAGLMINGEYIMNRVEISFDPGSGSSQSLVASSNDAIFAGGIFADAYVGDLWSFSLNALYAYDLGGTWSAHKAGDLFGTSYSAGQAINDSDDVAIPSNLSHWRIEGVLRLAFY